MIKNFLCFLSVLFFAGNVYAGSASAKLSALAESLIEGYEAKAGISQAVLAVFPFSCEEKLHKQRVGFAVSELMSHRFVANANFTVVERGDLNKLLSEHKLQASGAVDSDTAARLGKILGAKVMLLGNIQKVDGKYQVNARLVNAETSKVIVSGYEELGVETFDDDAGAYLNLVPQEQTLGLYLLYNYRNNPNKLGANVSTGYCVTATCTRNPFKLGMVGIGMRYFPVRNIFVDVAAMKSTGAPNTGKYQAIPIGIMVTSIRGLLGYKVGIADRTSVHLGFGAAGYSLSQDASVNYLTPIVQARLEYRVQARMGVSIAAGYDFQSRIADSAGDSWAKLNKLHFEPSLSLYF